jgi:hypothetical protein
MLILQTLLVAFARSDTTNPDLWIRLKKSMIVAHRWPQPLNQWVVSDGRFKAIYNR